MSLAESKRKSWRTINSLKISPTSPHPSQAEAGCDWHVHIKAIGIGIIIRAMIRGVDSATANHNASIYSIIINYTD